MNSLVALDDLSNSAGTAMLHRAANSLAKAIWRSVAGRVPFSFRNLYSALRLFSNLEDSACTPDAFTVLKPTVLADKRPVQACVLFAPEHRGSRPDPRARALARPRTQGR